MQRPQWGYEVIFFFEAPSQKLLPLESGLSVYICIRTLYTLGALWLQTNYHSRSSLWTLGDTNILKLLSKVGVCKILKYFQQCLKRKYYGCLEKETLLVQNDLFLIKLKSHPVYFKSGLKRGSHKYRLQLLLVSGVFFNVI